jgi:hypothetical protein
MKNVGDAPRWVNRERAAARRVGRLRSATQRSGGELVGEVLPQVSVAQLLGKDADVDVRLVLEGAHAMAHGPQIGSDDGVYVVARRMG